MALERFRDVVASHEELMVKGMFEDVRIYDNCRYGRVRVNIYGDRDGDIFVRNCDDFLPEEVGYNWGKDAYVLAVKVGEEMAVWRVPETMSRKEMCCRRRVQSTALMHHVVQHVFDFDIFDLVEKEHNVVLPIIVRGEVYHTDTRINLYRRFLFGLAKYLVDRNVVQYLTDALFDRFLAVFGNLNNWISGRRGILIFSYRSDHMPFFGDILSNLAGLLSFFRAEVEDVTADMKCRNDPCLMVGDLSRYFFVLDSIWEDEA